MEQVLDHDAVARLGIVASYLEEGGILEKFQVTEQLDETALARGERKGRYKARSRDRCLKYGRRGRCHLRARDPIARSRLNHRQTSNPPFRQYFFEPVAKRFSAETCGPSEGTGCPDLVGSRGPEIANYLAPGRRIVARN